MGGEKYELIDFGEGRKLERLASRVVDRPSPAAIGVRKRKPNQWGKANSRFDESKRRWRHDPPWPDDTGLNCGRFTMPVFPTPFGHIGVFPEQQENWDWLDATAPPSSVPQSGMNLFGYTGASSIAMACSGMNVAHVDAAKPNVNVARQAATLNGLADHPIRYLVDDAAKFAAREVRRGNHYHTIVLDPPAYGHSPKGKAWRLERDLWPLLDDCLRLLTPESFRLLITGHSPEVDADDVLNYLERNSPDTVGLAPSQLAGMTQTGRLSITDACGRKLDAGFYVRCHYPRPSDH